jgi:RNA polymerase sigma-70 factor (ECF subfamily)
MTSADQVVEFDLCLASAREGDSDAFGLLWKTFHTKLTAYARRLDPIDYDDIVSETWIGVHSAVARFYGSEEDFEAFLRSICRRRAVDSWRRKRRIGWEELAEDRPQSAEPTPEEAISSLEDLRYVKELIGRLPKRQRAIVTCRYLYQLSYAEAAVFCGSKEGSLRIANHRALENLARYADQVFDPDGVGSSIRGGRG